MAQSQGVSKSTVNNIWRAHNLQPHRTETFKLSRDPKFLEKMTDVVGLYLNPPQQAIVLCVDEKSQIQALDRTQPGLPIKKGRCGTTPLFAALETLEGKVVGECHERHRHQEFLKFLRRIDAEFPGDVPLHMIMDNYGTHKHAKVKAWLKRNPRFVSHFVPTSSSWMNLVERWFGHLDKGYPSRRLPQRSRPEGVHRRVSQSLESGSQTLRVDRDGRIHPEKAHPLPSNPGAD
jgi:transposase